MFCGEIRRVLWRGGGERVESCGGGVARAGKGGGGRGGEEFEGVEGCVEEGGGVGALMDEGSSWGGGKGGWGGQWRDVFGF